MAKVLKKFQFSRKGKHPWEEWSDGSIYQLVAGEDFSAEIKVQGLANQAYQYARRHGMKVQTEINDLGLVVQFTPVEEAE